MNKKISGTLCQCTSHGQENYLSLGIGVNLHSSPVPNTSTNLSEILGQNSVVDIDEFVKKLAFNVVEKFGEADNNGFDGQLRNKVISMLELKGEKVNIFDNTLTKILDEGIFTGINRFGHAQILKEEKGK